MLQTIITSRNEKTGNIAQTYRAAPGNMYGNCPKSCPLNPNPDSGTSKIDPEYFNALLGAVPKRGQAFTYTHFPTTEWVDTWRAHRDTGKPTTTVNYSADSRANAKRAIDQQIPVVIAVPADQARKVERVDGVRYVQCPATYNKDVQCENCGGGRPLCARADRDYVITFPAHGAAAKKVGTNRQGGCYASGGNVALHWRKLSKRAETESDASILRSFVRKLRPGRILRHHVAGDIGAAS